MKRYVALAAAAMVAAPFALSTPAEAGGLFGKKGLIRGSVGRFVEKNVNPIATPVLRKAVVIAAGAGGAVVGGLVGAPQVGAALGAAAGEGINKAAE